MAFKNIVYDLVNAAPGLHLRESPFFQGQKTCDHGTAQFLKSCLVKLSTINGSDVSHDRASQYWCRRACSRSKLMESEQPRVSSLPDLAPSASAKYSPHGSGGDLQQFFLRADPLDNPFPGLTQSPPAAQSLGASFGYTFNGFVQSNVKTGNSVTTVVSQSSSIPATGMATYLLKQSDFLPNSTLIEWVPALWVYGNGNWDNPTKAFGDTSTLKAGPKAEFEVHPVPGDHLYSFFDFAPFYQTDFYGKEQAEGGTIGWVPLDREFFLGGVPNSFNPNDNLVTGFFEVRAEASDVNVRVPGQTNLTAHNYEWLGGAARVYLFPFLSTGDPDPTNLLTNRFSLVGTVQSYWDANSGIQATFYSAILQYKLTCPTSGTNCPYGAPSLSLEYDGGTDKDMLQTQKKLTLKSTYAY